MNANTAVKPRLDSIDQFRGFAIFLMVLANYMAGVNWIPAWLKHAQDIGLTIIDLVAPFFFFAIGLTYGPSLQNRLLRDGWGKTAGHFTRRFFTIMGIGFCIMAAGKAAGAIQDNVDWGVLQAIGMAGLITLLVIRLPAAARWAIGLALLGAYQIVLDRYWLQPVFYSAVGGIQGSLSWSAMLILSTALADLFHDKTLGRRFFSAASLVVLLSGLALALIVPVSKNRVSASYVLVTLGISGLVFFAFHLASTRLNSHIPLFSAWGQNPLLLYVLHDFLLGIYAMPAIPGWYAEAPLWLVVAQAIALLGVLSAIGFYLRRKKWFVTL